MTHAANDAWPFLCPVGLELYSAVDAEERAVMN